MRGFLIVAGGIALTAAAGAAAWQVWDAIGGPGIGWQGYLALGLGAGLSLLIGGGLIALMFVSARRGYDDIDRKNGG